MSKIENKLASNFDTTVWMIKRWAFVVFIICFAAQLLFMGMLSTIGVFYSVAEMIKNNQISSVVGSNFIRVVAISNLGFIYTIKFFLIVILICSCIEFFSTCNGLKYQPKEYLTLTYWQRCRYRVRQKMEHGVFL